MVSDQEWEEFKAKFYKSYKDDKEEQMRREIYSECKKKIDEHNKRYAANEEPYTLDIREYSDYTPEELSTIDWNVCKAYMRTRNRGEMSVSDDFLYNLPRK